jgi:ABC-type transport system involved in multi-copper enzyme maturation permease subunit
MLFVRPIVNRELVTYLRRGQAFWFLWVYLVLLCFMVTLHWIAWSAGMMLDRSGLSRNLFTWAAYMQIIMAGLLGIFIGSGQISSERRRGTFDILMTTPLRPYEIMLGKAAASVGYLLLLAVAGTPVYSICFLLGGVAWQELGVMIYLTVLTGVTYTMIGVACSAPQLRKRTQEHQSGIGIAFMLNGGIALLLLLVLHFVLGLPGEIVGPAWGIALFAFSPVAAFFALTSPMIGQIGLPLVGTSLLLAHTAAEIGVFCLFLWLGCRWIRRQKVVAVPRAQTQPVPQERHRSRLALVRLFPIPDFINPVAAKDVLLSLPRRKIVRILLAIVVVGLFGMAVWGILEMRTLIQWSDAHMFYDISAMMTVGIALLLIFLRASGVVPSEAESGTLALLAVTPLSAGRVIWGKLQAVLVTTGGAVAAISLGLVIVFALCYPNVILHMLLTAPLALVAMVAGGMLYGSFSILISTGAKTARAAGTRVMLLLLVTWLFGLPSIMMTAAMLIKTVGQQATEWIGYGIAALLFPAFLVLVPPHLTELGSFRWFLFAGGIVVSLLVSRFLIGGAAWAYVRRVRREQEKQAKS